MYVNCLLLVSVDSLVPLSSYKEYMYMHLEKSEKQKSRSFFSDYDWVSIITATFTLHHYELCF